MVVFRKRVRNFCAHAAKIATSPPKAWFIIVIFNAVAFVACGIPAEPLPESQPLQSAVATPGIVAPTSTPITPVAVQAATLAPSATSATATPPPTVVATTPAPNQAATQALIPTVNPAAKGPAATATPAPTLDPLAPPTPTVPDPSGLGTFLTSTSVVGTITAQAATPTYPPTDTPRPRRRPVIIGAAGDAVPPTTVPDKTGITVQTKSQRVFPKGPATLTIKTKPNVACELSNIRADNGKDVLEPISSGSAKTSGSDGVIAWIWSVDGDEPLGTMMLVIDCRSVGVKQVTMDVAK
jgi:hypothetical protein